MSQKYHHHERRSMHLQDFLAQHHTYALNEICKHVHEFSLDRDGSILIQSKLDGMTENQKMDIFDAMLPNLNALMTNRFARFLVMKFLQIGDEKQRFELYLHIIQRFARLSVNKYGCQVVQMAIEEATVLELYCLARRIDEGNFIQLATNVYGNFVIQKIFETSTNIRGDRYVQVN